MANGNDYGWAYVKQGILTGSGGGAAALQFATSGNDITGSANLTYDYASTNLFLSGNLSVSGAINANSLNINVTNRTVTNITSTGSTKFGDSADDIHEFTGSVKTVGSLSASLAISASAFYGNGYYLSNVPVKAYTNAANNRIMTSVDSESINAEANLTFNGSNLSVSGDVTATGTVSASLGSYTNLTASAARIIELTVGTGSVLVTGNSISGLQQITSTSLIGTLATAAQTNITSVGNLTNLTVDSTTLVVNSTSHRVGLGRTAPTRILDISHSSDPQLRLTNNGSVYSELQTTAGGYLYITSSGGRTGIGTNLPTANLAVSGTSHFSGNVGIGTTSPAYKLDVSGDARITGNLIISGTLNARETDFKITADTLIFGDSATDSVIFNAATASAPNGLNFDSNTLVLDTANNRVGIGTVAPETTLHVQNGSAGTITAVDNAVLILESNEKPRLQFQSPGAYGGTIVFGSPTDNDEGQIDYDHGSDRFLFKTGGNTKMSILGDNVGIGTSAPERKLHVVGNTIITGDLGVTGSITGSHITDGTVVITGGNISSANQISATGLTGTLATAAQGNITSVGTLVNLAVDSPTFVVKNATHRVGIGRDGPQRILDVSHSTEPQLRLTNNNSVYSELQTNSTGYLHIYSTGGRVGIGTSSPTDTLTVSGTLAVSGALSVANSSTVKFNGLQLASATTSSFLALDSNNNLILTSSGTVVTSYVSASILNYTNASNNRIMTSVDSTSVNAEANLTFDGSILSITGELSSSVGVSSSAGQFGEVTGVTLTDGTLTLTNGQLTNASLLSGSNITSHELTASHVLFANITATNIAGTLSTAAQTNITSVGALGSLVVDTNTLVVKSTTNRVGIGRTGPQRKLDVLHTVASPQARISYDSTNYGELQATSAGHLTLLSSGGNIGIGNTSPNHALTVTGDISASVNVSASYYYGDGSKLTGINAGISYSRRAINSNATASVNDVLLGVSGSTAIQIRLPAASGYTSGQYFTVKDESGNANVNNITILITGSDTIDGQPSIVLESPYAAVNIYTNGSNKFFVY